MKKGKSFIWIIWMLLGLLLIINIIAFVHFMITNRVFVVSINEEPFPDPVFRTYVEDNIDLNQDGVLIGEEVRAVRRLELANMEIADLTGIEYFSRILLLRCDENQLTSLDLSKNTELVYLSCYHNQLTDLNVTENVNLRWLICFGNPLAGLDLSCNKLLSNLKCEEIKIDVPLYQSEEKYYIDLSELLPDKNKLILDSQIGTYDSVTGRIYLLELLEVGDEFSYEYETGFKDGNMEVTVVISDIIG